MTSTRERILAAATRLFAEQGYNGTSVGDVEAAAGLTPRAGALYKHFASKAELLQAVVAEHRGMDDLDVDLGTLDLGDVGAEIVLIGRVGLLELRREQDLIRIVMKEGDRFPEVAAAFREVVVQRSHRLAAGWVRRRLPDVEDPEALGAVLVESLVGFVIQELLVGEIVPEERFREAWVQVATAAMKRSSNV